MQNEPVVVGAVGQIVAAVIAALVAFGVDLNDAQRAALLGLWAAVAALIAAWQRSRVTPV